MVATFSMNWMDRVIAAQTYPERPMTTHHVMDSAAPFERESLGNALTELVNAIPELHSIIIERRLRLQRIRTDFGNALGESQLHYLNTPLDPHRDDWFARPFALDREPPFRLVHAPRPGGGYQLIFTLHHSVTDGVGALALFDALLVLYAQAKGETDQEPTLPASRGAHLRKLLIRKGVRQVLTITLNNLRRARRFNEQRAALLTAPEARATSTECVVLNLAPERWSRLRHLANEQQCSRNDLMLGAFLRAAHQWRKDQGLPDADYRALIPADLRTEFGIGPSLQNHLGVIEADFTQQEVMAPELANIVRGRIRAERIPDRVLATPSALGILSLLPPAWMRRFFHWLDERHSAFMYSFLFSHIRIPEGIHWPTSVSPERVYCLSTLPRQPGVGITITALPQSVTVTLAYPPPRLTRTQAQALMRAFDKTLSMYCGEEKPTPKVATTKPTTL